MSRKSAPRFPLHARDSMQTLASMVSNSQQRGRQATTRTQELAGFSKIMEGKMAANALAGFRAHTKFEHISFSLNLYRNLLTQTNERKKIDSLASGVVLFRKMELLNK